MILASLSTEALFDGLIGLLGTERRTLAELLRHLVEVEDRGAHLEKAYSSLFDFCTRKLGLSEGEAFRRINAARLARRFPVVLEMIASGKIHLTALVLLRDYLTSENHADLLEAAAGRSKRALAELIAARYPRPDVEPSIRKLPERSAVHQPSAAVGSPSTTPSLPLPSLSVPNPFDAVASSSGAGTSVSGAERPPTPIASAALPCAPLPSPRVPWATGHVEALSSARYKVQLTASAELKEKLERAARLMSHRSAPNDLAAVVDAALDHLIGALEKERFGKTASPRASRRAKVGHITASVRRAVVARDAEQCTWVSADGERCPARTFLEVDHRHPRALGGSGEVDNVRLLCRAHNRFAAERVFGKQHVAARIDARRNERPPALRLPTSEPSPGTASTRAPFFDATNDRASITARSRDAAPRESASLLAATAPQRSSAHARRNGHR